MGSLSIVHWIIIIAVALLLFGGRGKISSLMGDFAPGRPQDHRPQAGRTRHVAAGKPQGRLRLRRRTHAEPSERPRRRTA